MNGWIIVAVTFTGILQCFGDVEVVIDKSGTCTEYSERNVKCIFAEGSTTELKLTKLTSIVSYESVASIFTQSPVYDLTEICTTDLNVLKSVTSCLVNSYRSCGDNDFKTLIPTSDQYSSAIDYACNNKDVIMPIIKCFGNSIVDCIANKEARQSLTDGAKLARSNEFSEWSNYHCGKRTIDLECKKIDEDYKECTTEQHSVYEELMSKIKPEACNGVNGLMYSVFLLLVSVSSLLHRYL